jgi:hypothetical protein
MKLPDEPFDLDAEIARFGGRLILRMSPVDQTIEGPDPVEPAAPTLDLDAEIARFGGQVIPQPATSATLEGPLAILRRSDASACQEAESFAKILGASVDMVVPRGVPDPRIPIGMSWPRWEARRLEQVFRNGRVTMAEADAQQEKGNAESAAWRDRWRRVQHGWAKWWSWHLRAPADADEYRREHEDGQIGWLLELGAPRTPSGGKSAVEKKARGK